MINEILNFILNIINANAPAIMSAIGVVIAYVINKAKAKYEEKITDEKVRSIVKDVVNYVEQKMVEGGSEVKFQIAVDKIQEILKEKGILITDTEIEILIESTVKNLK